jgi:thiol:disulfide interchange protein DsbD
MRYDEALNKPREQYAGNVEIRVPVQGTVPGFDLAIESQGCADAGLCYPPTVTRLPVRFDSLAAASVASVASAASAASAASVASVAPPSELERIQAALASGSLWSVMLLFFGLGALLSLTPCVLPMVPILSSIIVGQGGPMTRGRGLVMSASYSLGMAAVYTAMGVAAGLAGEGLAAALQKPWVLATFAGLLFVLALSMFDVYTLQLPNALQTRLNGAAGRLPGGRLLSVFAMGGVSALVVGPCVAAPLAGALVYIGQSRNVVLGGAALFAMAAGMSLPLLLTGLSAGSLLPRAGRWMESVKRFFGVLLIAVAVWMVSPVLPAPVVMLAWGGLAIGCAAFLSVFDPLPPDAPGSRRLAKAAGVVLAVGGLAQLAGGMSGGRDPLQPLAHLAGGGGARAAEPAATFKRISSPAELAQRVQDSGRPVVLDFYADWCVSCKEMERVSFADTKVAQELGRFERLQVDVTANTDSDRALMKKFGLFGPPAMVFFDGAGRDLPRAKLVGFVEPGKLVEHLAGIR